MPTGKLQISRGSDLPALSPKGPQSSLIAPEAEPATALEPTTIEDERGHQIILARLDVLERLARLRSLELLTAEEYAFEKAFVLARTAEGVAGDIDNPLAAKSTAKPPLVGRLFSWKLLPVSLIAGLALSFGIQPQETIRFFDQALSQIGA